MEAANSNDNKEGGGSAGAIVQVKVCPCESVKVCPRDGTRLDDKCEPAGWEVPAAAQKVHRRRKLGTEATVGRIRTLCHIRAGPPGTWTHALKQKAMKLPSNGDPSSALKFQVGPLAGWLVNWLMIGPSPHFPLKPACMWYTSATITCI